MTNSSYFLTANRIGFRKWQTTDFHLAKKLWGDPAVTKLIDTRGQLSDEQVQEKLDNEVACNREYGVQYWPIFLLITDEHIGCCGLRPYDLNKNIYETGVHLKPQHWRKGYAVEAERGVINYAFETMKVSALFAGHNPENAVSRKVIMKLGFTYMRDEYYEPTGLMHPSYMLSREEWTTGKSTGIHFK